MIEIKGYKHVSYPDFQKLLSNSYKATEGTNAGLMSAISADSVQTAKNVFKVDGQIVSDEKLTKAMKYIRLAGFVIWIFGTRYYYVKNK